MKMEKGIDNPGQESPEQEISFDEVAYQLGIDLDRLDYFFEKIDKRLLGLNTPLERKDGAMFLELIEMFVEDYRNPESAIDQVNRVIASLSHPSNIAAAEAMGTTTSLIATARSNLVVAMAKVYNKNVVARGKETNAEHLADVNPEEWLSDRVELFLQKVSRHTWNKDVDISKDMLIGLIYEIVSNPKMTKDEIWQNDLDFLNSYLTDILPPKPIEKGITPIGYLNYPSLNRLASAMANRFNTVSNARVDPNNFSPYEVEKFQAAIDPNGSFFAGSLTEAGIDILMENYKNNQLRKNPGKDLLSKLNKETSAFLLYLSGVDHETISDQLGIKSNYVSGKVRAGVLDELRLLTEPPEIKIQDIVLLEDVSVSRPDEEKVSEELPKVIKEIPKPEKTRPVPRKKIPKKKVQIAPLRPQVITPPKPKERKIESPQKMVEIHLYGLVREGYFSREHAEVLKQHLDIENKVKPTRDMDTITIRKIEAFDRAARLLQRQALTAQTTRKIHQLKLVGRLFGDRKRAIAPVSRKYLVREYKEKLEQHASSSPDEVEQKISQFARFLDLSLAELLGEAITSQDL